MNRPVPHVPVYLFDVDGTLMDSAPDICAAQLAVLAANGRDDVSEDFLRRYIGRHLIGLFQDLGFADDAMEPLIQSYRTDLLGSKTCQRRAYFQGVAEMLDSLGGPKSTATIKTIENYARGAGAIRIDPALRSRARHRWISCQA